MTDVELDANTILAFVQQINPMVFELAREKAINQALTEQLSKPQKATPKKRSAANKGES